MTDQLVVKLFADGLDVLMADLSMTGISRNDVRTLIETLVTIYKNLSTNRDQYKRINTNNKSFNGKVWSHVCAQQFMLRCGWTQDTAHTNGQYITFDDQMSDTDVRKCLQLLVDRRLSVKPDANDWVNGHQLYVNPCQQSDHQLRSAAEQQRLKEVADYERNQLETKLLAQNIKKEIESDIKHRKQMAQPMPQPPNQLTTQSQSQSTHKLDQ